MKHQKINKNETNLLFIPDLYLKMCTTKYTRLGSGWSKVVETSTHTALDGCGTGIGHGIFTHLDVPEGLTLPHMSSHLVKLNKTWMLQVRFQMKAFCFHLLGLCWKKL